MVIMMNLKIVIFFIILNNIGDSQQHCRYRDFVHSGVYSEEYIYLLESSNERHSAINRQFIGEINKVNIYPMIIYDNDDCQLKVEDIILLSKSFPYLINLYVPDFYQNNYNKLTESLAFAGDINDIEIKVDVCKVHKDSKDENRTCDPFVEKRKQYVKLSTNQIEKEFEDIFKTVIEFQPNGSIEKKLNVVNCGKIKIPNYYNDFEIIDLEDCSFLKSVEYNTLAILAPKVFNFTRPIDNPVVFYEDSYITKETKDWFRNSMTAVPWQSLKYGFLFLFMELKWQRVTIVSDTNEFSQEFEKELTTLFRENGIAYMVETCVTKNCRKVINKIDESYCKIIVANFDFENMEEIAEFAKSKGLVSARHIFWITRNLSVKKAKEIANMLNSEIFNISFEINLHYILQIIDMISSKIQVNCDTKPCSFSKTDAATELNNSLKISKIEISSVINRAQISIGWIHIEDDRITKKYFNPPYPRHIKDSFMNCTFWNDRFEKPCNDTELILIMVVLSIFFLTVLGVVLFFQSPELLVSYRRMR